MTNPHIDEPAGVPEQSGPGGLVRLRIDVAYDGSGFHGWARQPGLRSVQAELEGALRTVLRIPGEVPVRVAVAGRTDSGVHATGQVCHADVPAGSWPGPRDAGSDGEPEAVGARVRQRLNRWLAPDLRVHAVHRAPEGFDARWSAAWRRYEYLVADRPEGQDPRTRGHVLWHPRGLDVPAMDRAARAFVGEHDFAAFCRARDGASSVRTIHEIGWVRGTGDPAGRGSLGATAAGAGGPARFEVRADAFCHSMVRSLVGAFLAVGDGRWPEARPAELLRAGQRVPQISCAPAHGLTLCEVGYPADGDLAAQAQRAKRWRGR